MMKNWLLPSALRVGKKIDGDNTVKTWWQVQLDSAGSEAKVCVSKVLVDKPAPQIATDFIQNVRNPLNL
ncbi:hypothetical protein PM082_012286 [Marasmius tenuissimus]|nr:hypothetical protein PM082_012286 [Marasmius tenuissimus]